MKTLIALVITLMIITACSTAAPTAAQGVLSAKQGCPLTARPDPRFVPPAPYPPFPDAGYFYHGSAGLWTALPDSGEWGALPYSDGHFHQKLVYWSDVFDMHAEPQPDITITLRHLDSELAPMVVSEATHGYVEPEKSFILSGLSIPESGCWEISAQYKGSGNSFVIWVEG
jgi:hypothetical protein